MSKLAKTGADCRDYLISFLIFTEIVFTGYKVHVIPEEKCWSTNQPRKVKDVSETFQERRILAETDNYNFKIYIIVMYRRFFRGQ